MKQTPSDKAGSKRTTIRDASRIYSSTAKRNGGVIPKGSHAARAMRAAMRNAKKSK